MKKHLLLVILIMALVLSFSCGALAAQSGAGTSVSGAADPNQYDVASGISSGLATDDLWIGTLDAWKAAGGDVQGTNTFFDNGEAIHGDDIIMTNGVCGIVLAVGTRNPWGYPAGSVLDAGTVNYTSGALTTATGNRDMTWSIEPLVYGWDSWAPDNCGVVKFSIVKYDFDAKAEVTTGGLTAVKVFRIYDIGGIKFNVNTYYGIGADQSFAYMYNSFENTTGSAVSVGNRFSVTNKGDDGGAMFGIDQSIGSYAMTGGMEYFCGLYYGGNQFSKIGGSVGYKELRTASNYAAGETKVVDTYIVMSDTADFQELNNLIYDVQGVSAFTTVSGTTVANGTVVVKKDGATIGWYKADAEGSFSFQVPQDESTYTMYLEAKGYADGAAVEIDNSGTTDEVGSLAAGVAKVNMKMTVKDQEGNPIFAKIEVFESKDGDTYVSAYPTIRFNGDSVYYTEADSKGESTGVIDFEVEAGYYKVVVYGEGYWFYCEPMVMTGNTADSTTLYPEVDMVFSAPEGWLAGDAHHHGNKNDAFSAPGDVIKSLAASGLDVGFMTDHDFTTNNAEMYDLSADYGLSGFVPSEEISCSWAHFNVIPLTSDGYAHFLDVDQKNPVMNQFAQLPVFVKQTHDNGAAITANHPWYSYGLFYADSVDAIPGGYTDDYDNIEINASCVDSENVEVLLSTIDLWTSYQDGTALYQDVNGDDVITEKAHYLVGGSDTHDVRYPGFADKNNYSNNRGDGWYASGKIRTYAYVGTDVTENTKGDYIKDNGLAYSEAVVNGNSYITYGPVLDMNKLPGETYKVYQNSEFNAYVEVSSLAEIQNFYVLTKDGTDDLTAMGKSMYSEEYLKYDAYATNDLRNSINYDDEKQVYEVEVDIDVYDEDTWAALLVLDENGNYAITNPWWIQSNRFSDVPSICWYGEAVAFGYNAGIINGYGDGTFRPLNQVTRAEFAKMCYGLLDAAEENMYFTPFSSSSANLTFSDVKSGAWYYDAVMFMADSGYVNGYPDKTFKPNSYISRAEIAQIMYKIALDVYKDALPAWRQMYFADVAKGAWYYEAVMNLADAGLVNGYAVPSVTSGQDYPGEKDYYFQPNNTATRAESMQFVFNLVWGPMMP
ncbi:MAG TPA: S-layer homology domain-containing protein [Clostridiales bacterium]|nr:S-layer homology domain-containing protein [Clostridiales bacterium]